MMTTDPKQKTTNCLSKFFNFVGIVSEQAEILADFCGKHSPSQFMIPRSLQKEGIRKFLDILKVRFFKNQIFKKRLESYQQLLPSKNGENADQNANSENILATKVVGESEKKLIENDKFIENCADKNAEIISGPIQQNTNACEIKGSSVISNTDGLVDGLVEDGVDGSVDDEVDETVENGIDKLVECEVDEKIEKLVQNQKYIKQDSFVVGKVKKFTVNIVDGVIKVDPVCLSGESSNPSRSSEIKKTIRENTWKPETGTVLPKCRSGLSLQKKITNATVSPTNEQTSSSTITEQDIEVTVKGHLEEFDMKEWLTIFKIEALLETESQILFKYTPGSFVEEARNFALSRKTPLEIIFPEQFVVQDNNDGELPTIQQKFWHEIDCRKDHDVYE
uniref:Uncharacterized protein n=1 Tax=Panagrolaimus sp. JU765 TaxID=591449 RepID=A0AC34R9H7_9BILA